MKKLISLFVLSLLPVTASYAEGVEHYVNRWGSDYKNINLSQPQSSLCKSACDKDAKCKAWTYVKPGIQGASAKCWLKHSVPAPKTDSCCISGVKGQSQVTYPIVCRGGGSVRFTYVTHLASTNRSAITVGMKKGVKKAGANWENISALQPGQCTWVDRILDKNEPYQLVFHDIHQFTIVWRNNQVLGGIPDSLTYIKNLSNPNKYLSFNVYNNRKGSFVVSSIGRSL